MKRIKLDAHVRSLVQKSRKASANDDAPRDDERELIIIYGARNYPSAWNRGREDREQPTSHTVRSFRRIQVIDGLHRPT